MNRRTLPGRATLTARASVLAAAFALSCSGAPPRDPDARGGSGGATGGGGAGGSSGGGGTAASGTSGDAGAGDGGTSGTSAGSGGTAGSGGDVTCNELVPGTEPVDYVLLEDEQAPQPLGGEPSAGVYDLTALVSYGGEPDCFEPNETAGLRYTVALEPDSGTSGRIDVALTFTGGELRSSSSYEVEGTDLVTTTSCPSGGTESRVPFSSTDSTFVFHAAATCGSLVYETQRR